MGKVAIAGISLILVVGVVIGVVATVSRGNGKVSSSEHDTSGGISTGMKAVDTLCSPTKYKDLCVSTLTPVANKDASATPKDLVQAAFDATMKAVQEALNKSSSMDNLAPTEVDKRALASCRMLIDNAAYDLQKAINKLLKNGIQSMDQMINDLSTWLASVDVYTSVCVDEIDHPELKKAMGDGVMNTTRLTNNALAIIETIDKVLSKINVTIPSFNFNQRRLLTDDIDKDGQPTWLSVADRKLLAANNNQIKPNVVVAKDGSGQFKTINEAIASVPKNFQGRYIIFVKAGVYAEYVLIPKKMNNIFMYGEGNRRTIVTGDRNTAIKKYKTSLSGTFTVQGDGFIAKSMCFRNTAGPDGHQAVALLSSGDFNVFHGCRIDGYQDTLYYQSNRSFYYNCIISGTVDFIFGSGAAVIQNCKIIARLGKMSQWNAVTADGRKDPAHRAGLVIQNCRIVPETILIPQKLKKKSYLGRPWTPYARTMIMETEIGDFISPEGYMPFNIPGQAGANNHLTCEYKEYANRGPGANTSGRVKWSTFKVVDRKVAEQFTVRNFLEGLAWLPNTNVPFHPDLRP